MKYKCIDRDITYSCMYLYVVFFYYNTNDKLIYISSPFSNQGLPEVNEFLYIHPKPQCLHIVYTIITAIPTWNLRFLYEFKIKVGLGGVNPTGHRH